MLNPVYNYVKVLPKTVGYQRNQFEIPIQVDKLVVDVKIANTSIVVAVGHLELVRC